MSVPSISVVGGEPIFLTTLVPAHRELSVDWPSDHFNLIALLSGITCMFVVFSGTSIALL